MQAARGGWDDSWRDMASKGFIESQARAISATYDSNLAYSLLLLLSLEALWRARGIAIFSVSGLLFCPIANPCSEYTRG